MGFIEDMQKHFSGNCRAREYDAHFSKVHSVAWNCDGTRLASGSYDKTAVSFVLERDRLVGSTFGKQNELPKSIVLFQSKDHTFRGHGDSVDQLCWHPKHPDLFVTASGDKTVQLWDARSRKSAASIATKGENKSDKTLYNL
jgi:THO complex subunit 3